MILGPLSRDYDIPILGSMSFLGSTFSGVTHTLVLPLCGQTDNYGVDKLYADLRQMHFILQRVMCTRNVTPFHTFMCTRNFIHSCVHTIRNKAISTLHELTKNPKIGDRRTVHRGAMPITKPTIEEEMCFFSACKGVKTGIPVTPSAGSCSLSN